MLYLAIIWAFLGLISCLITVSKLIKIDLMALDKKRTILFVIMICSMYFSAYLGPISFFVHNYLYKGIINKNIK